MKFNFTKVMNLFKKLDIPVKLLFPFLIIILITSGSKDTISSIKTNVRVDSIYGYAKDSVLSDNDLRIIRLNEEKQLYESKCQKCHSLHDPQEFTQKRWKKILKSMRYKADLTKNEYKLIFDYLSENSLKQ